MGSRWRPAFIVAAACREIEPRGERGGGESLLATSPLLLEEFMARGRIDGGDEGSEFRSGAMLARTKRGGCGLRQLPLFEP